MTATVAAPPHSGRHNPALQSLRGIAACVVMVHHSLRTLRPAGWAWTISETLLNAHAAVVIFFVLSGYVLSRSLVGRDLSVRGIARFYVRRAFRIYPALWLGIMLGCLYGFCIRPLPAPDLSGWVLGHYQPSQLTARAAFVSVVGLGNALLPPAWTITVELCASVVLPGILWCCLRRPARIVPIVVVLALIGLVAGLAARQVPLYLVDFALGAALAVAPASRIARPSRLAMAAALIVLLGAQLVLPWGRWFWLLSLIEGLSSFVLIGGIVAHGVPWLHRRSLVAIGDWSYGIYVLHLPIAFALAQLVDHAGLVIGHVDGAAVMVAIVTAAVTVPLAGVVHTFVERPGIALGAALLRRSGGAATVVASRA